MNQYELISADEAARRLGVKRATLYAYVSRGRLRSVAVPGSRERHYREADIAALLRRGSAEAADSPAMPLIQSAISLIEDGRLYYRGEDAVRLSDHASLEDIARLLWGSYPDLAGPDPAPDDRSREAVALAGRRILAAVIGCLTGQPADTLPVHRQLARHWRLDRAGGELLRRCLVLVADHELNASTLAARVVASTGASPYFAVAAALGALSGPRHGGATAEVEALLREAAQDGDPFAAAAERLGRGETLPGIGHPLYPDGDPRAVAILYALSAIAPEARRLVGRQPNIDFALAAAAVVLRLPPGAALSLYVIGRTVGWIAHAIEQYESGLLIRPRALYTGPRPNTETPL